MVTSLTTVKHETMDMCSDTLPDSNTKPTPFHGKFGYNSCAKNTTVSSTLTHPQDKTVVWTSNVHRLASANGTTKLIASNSLPPRVIASTNHYNIIYPQAVNTWCFISFHERLSCSMFLFQTLMQLFQTKYTRKQRNHKHNYSTKHSQTRTEVWARRPDDLFATYNP